MSQVVRCRNCGAPLDVGPGQLHVTCGYCGVSNRLAPIGPLPTHVPHVPAASTSSGRRPRTGLTIVVTLAVLLVLCGGIFSFLVVRVGVSKPATNVFTNGLLEWYTPTCLVDANGDDALDIAGLSAAPGSALWTLRVVDGASGSVLWSEKDYKPQVGVVCASPRFFGIDGDDFQMRLFQARSLSSPPSPLLVPLSDHIDKLGQGNDCLLVKTRDGKQNSVSLTNQPVSQCTPLAMMEPWGDWGVENSRGLDGLQHTSGTTTYLLEYRTPGTPFLTMTAHSQHQQLWSTDLRVVKPNGGLSFAVTPSMLVVYAIDPSDNDYGVLVGLDPTTGLQRYAQRQDSHSSASFRSFHWNGRFVLIDWGFGLHAYDPTDGRRVWHIGGR